MMTVGRAAWPNPVRRTSGRSLLAPLSTLGQLGRRTAAVSAEAAAASSGAATSDVPQLYVRHADGHAEVRIKLPSGADLIIARG